jgi:hypothetical protein
MDKWLNHNPQTKQGKQLNPDKVIEWLRQELPKTTWLPNKVIEKFKKDFGLC